MRKYMQIALLFCLGIPSFAFAKNDCVCEGPCQAFGPNGECEGQLINDQGCDAFRDKTSCQAYCISQGEYFDQWAWDLNSCNSVVTSKQKTITTLPTKDIFAVDSSGCLYTAKRDSTGKPVFEALKASKNGKQFCVGKPVPNSH